MVPSTLMRESMAGSAADLRTSIWAARWNTTSGLRALRAASATASASRMSSSTSSAPADEGAVEVLAAAGREVVEHRHLVAPLEQGVDEVRADESGAAGDQ